MMYLSQEVTSKDQQPKTQMAVSFQDDETKNSEKVWHENGVFDDRRSDLTFLKANFPENTLYYVSQCSVSLVKGGGEAIYLEFVACGQSLILIQQLI